MKVFGLAIWNAEMNLYCAQPSFWDSEFPFTEAMIIPNLSKTAISEIQPVFRGASGASENI